MNNAQISEKADSPSVGLSDLLATHFTGKDNYGKPKMGFVNKLLAMNDEDLQKQCEDFIWLSAYANNNPRSDYHWQCDACYDECQKRGKLEIYQRAYDYHVKSA